jgi:CubicO group peptidase (beta-lactamase class C family)
MSVPAFAVVPPGRTAVLSNWMGAEQNRWSFRNVNRLLPTEGIDRRVADHLPLERAEQDLMALPVTLAGEDLTLGGLLERTRTDGFLVLHRGRIVTEHYTPGMAADERHVMFSVSKSVLGMVFGILQARGAVEVARPVTDYLPELAGSGFDGATVQHLLDMSVELRFDEAYAAVGGDVDRYRRANGWAPAGPGDPVGSRDFFAGMAGTEGAHGSRFHYVSPCTDVAGWVAERATGQSWARLVQELLWQPIGAEYGAYITVDAGGAARAAGGLCATLRDMGRVALAMAGNARLAGVLPQAFLDDTFTGGDPAAWDRGASRDYIPGGRYRNAWYVRPGPARVALAIGIHGQWLHVDPGREVVIVRQASQALASEPETDQAMMAAFDTIAQAFG